MQDLFLSETYQTYKSELKLYWFQDAPTLQDLKMFLDNILKRTRCPVCFNTFRPPVAVCENGHSTCPDCKEKLSTCPFLNMKNRQFDDVLEIIIHLCRFEGCQVFVKTIDGHEKWCGYRKTDCKTHACEWKGCVTDLAEHFQKDHTESILRENKF